MENVYVNREATPPVGEGPYYKKGSPERLNIVENHTVGDRLVLEGRVEDQNGNPIANVWIDFWQADGKGEYDNINYNLRGHQYTDKSGAYKLQTVKPAMYGSRTPHIHVKLKANPQAPTLTSQLFFLGEERNTTETIFNPKLVMSVTEIAGKKQAKFDFVLVVT